MMGKVLGAIRSSYLGHIIARKLLVSPFLAGNPLYAYFYDKKIKRSSRWLEKLAPGIDIGTTNACNSDCIMCPHSKLKNIGFMGMDLYKKIIDNCKQMGIKSAVLSFFGEPLMDRQLIERIKYAKGKGMMVGFFTNASLLNGRWASELISSGVDGIVISFDAYTKKTYEKIRKGLKFHVVRKNILNLVRLREKIGTERPKINLVLVEQDENKGEIKRFYNEWEKLTNSISVINLTNRAGGINMSSSSSFHSRAGLKRCPCSLLWQRLVVDWNGDVVLCCSDWNHSVVLGNLKRQRIEEIWWGRKLENIRKIHMKGDFSEIPACDKCDKKTVWWFN